MNLFLRRNVLGLCAVIFVFLCVAQAASAQNLQCNKFKRLRAPASVRGFIGGESHDCYVIQARKGQTMTIEISWRREGDNNAGFDVRRLLNTSSDADRRLGRFSNNNRRWTGRIRETRKYYIDVVANPSARYVLKATLR